LLAYSSITATRLHPVYSIAELDQGQEPDASGHDAGHEGVWLNVHFTDYALR
jgi:hypothetical protein